MSDIATPRRRSARLQANNNNTPVRSRTVTPARKRLASVLEDDEATAHATHALNEDLTTTPLPKRQMPGSFDVDVDTMKTPESARPPKPAREEMHPAHAHQHTVRVSNIALDLGFSDVNPYQSSPLRSSFNSDALSPQPVPAPQAQSSPGYEFTFGRDRRDLSVEAQRIMESVREEALRIKEEMRKERDEEARKAAEADGITGRRYAKPKSRFSDAHQAEFDKMQSIADHVSTLKHRQQSSNPSSPIKEVSADATAPSYSASRLPQTPTRTGLKRSRSKVDLDHNDNGKASAMHSPSKTPTRSPSPSKLPSLQPSRQADASVSKRRKVDTAQDVSHVRPTSSGKASAAAPTSPKKSGIPSSLSTPTKATMARMQAAKTKTPRSEKSKFGSSRPSPTKSMLRPGGIRAASDRIASAVISKVNTVKSILHKPQPKYSDDPLKIAAGTHIPMPRETPSVHEGTPSLPATPHAKHTLPRPTPKRVEFAPDTKVASDHHVISPSPAKKASIRLLPPEVKNKNGVESGTGPSAPNKSPLSKVATVSYPKLPDPSPASTFKADAPARTSSPRPALSPLFSHPIAGDFTFSHDKRIVFASQPPTPQRQEPASTTPTSIRQIRASPNMPTPSFQPPRIGNTPKQIAHALNTLPAVPHGMTNKKRARSSTDDNGDNSSDIENIDPNRSMPGADSEGSPRKRAKMAPGVSHRDAVTKVPLKTQSVTSTAVRTPSSTRTKIVGRPSPAKSSPLKTPQRRQTGYGPAGPATTSPRKGLSLSRINFLARPKQR